MARRSSSRCGLLRSTTVSMSQMPVLLVSIDGRRSLAGRLVSHQASASAWVTSSTVNPSVRTVSRTHLSASARSFGLSKASRTHRLGILRARASTLMCESGV